MSRGSRIALAATMIAVAGPVSAAVAQDTADTVEAEGKVLEIEAKVLDIESRIATQEGAIATTESAERVQIDLSADVLFEFNRSDLTPRAVEAIEEAAAVIDERATGEVVVEGHTDSKGSKAFNRGLSLRRAQAVEAELAELVESDEVSFDVRGRGESDPVAPNTKRDGSDNPEGRALNRRVELRFAK